MSNSELFEAKPEGQPLPDASRPVLAQQWHELAQPGTWWTAQARIDIAATARAAYRHTPEPEITSLDEVTQRAARMVAADAGNITKSIVDGFVEEGMSPLHYVELVGIIARTTAIDTATLGLGNGLEPYLAAELGQPSNAVVASAKQRSALSLIHI